MSTPHKQTLERSHIAINIREFFHHTVFAVCIGVVCAFASMLLCLCVEGVYNIFTHAHWLIWFLPIMGVAQIFLYRWFTLPENLTTDMVINMMRNGKPISILLFPGILIGTCMSIISGGCVGKEAGALQMGASIGSSLGSKFHLKSMITHGNAEADDMHRYPAAVGMAAAFSGLFFAPLGSCFLVLELLRFSEIQNIITMLIACFVASSITQYFSIGDVISRVSIPLFNWHSVAFAVVIAVACAIGGTLLSLLISMVQSITQRISTMYFIWPMIAGCIYIALVVGLRWYDFTGTGGSQLNQILQTPSVSWGFAIKALLMIICLGFWFKGGEIMPSLCIGGLLGAASTVMCGGSPIFGAALGSMTFLAAFHRCPISAFFMGCEIFGWSIAPHLAIAVIIAIMVGYPIGMYGAGFSYFLFHKKENWLERLRDHEIDDELVEDKGPYDGITQLITQWRNIIKKPDLLHKN